MDAEQEFQVGIGQVLQELPPDPVEPFPSPFLGCGFLLSRRDWGWEVGSFDAPTPLVVVGVTAQQAALTERREATPPASPIAYLNLEERLDVPAGMVFVARHWSAWRGELAGPAFPGPLLP